MWYSFHAYIHDYTALDKYMRDIFPQFVKDNISAGEEWFFIRYWLGGPHIRLRLRKAGPFNSRDFQAKFKESVQDFVANEPIKLIDYDHFYTETMLAGEQIQTTYWKTHGDVEEEQYEPEFERYGGRSKMAYSESIFRVSSELALKLNTLSFHYRIISAIDLLYWTVQELGMPASTYSLYADMWGAYRQPHAAEPLRLQQLIAKRAASLGAASSPKDIYRPYLASLHQVESLPIHVALSHIHMTNNRIGVHPELEYEIARNLSERGELAYGRR